MNTETGLPAWSPLLALHRAAHATVHALRTELADLDLTASDLHVLANLADDGGRTVSGLGAAAGTLPTTLTSVLDRLERRGHITRGSQPGDRRAVLIELTASGRETAAIIRRAMTGLEHRALGTQPAGVMTALRAGLDALTAVSS